MKKWREVRLEDIIDVNPSVSLVKGKKYPFIDIDKLSPSLRSVVYSEMKEYTGQGSRFHTGDTLLARITPCLENRKIAQANTGMSNAFGSTEFYVLRAKKNAADPDFTYYLSSSDIVVLPAINSMTGASGRQRADKRFIERLKILVPDLETQRRIASMLVSYDNLIEVNNKRIKVLEQMAENLYKEWFVRFRFPGHETAEFENGIPKGWEYGTVESLSSVLQRGISPDYDDAGNLTVISQKCIRQNIMDIRESRRQAKAFKPELNLIDGDTVICSTGTGTLGRVGQVYGDYPDTTFDSHVTLVRAKENIGKHFLYWTLKEMQPWFMNMGIGSTNQQELYRSTIKNAKALCPDNKLIAQFESIIESIHRNTILLIKSQENLIKQRDLLLPRLMSGKLEV